MSEDHSGIPSTSDPLNASISSIGQLSLTASTMGSTLAVNNTNSNNKSSSSPSSTTTINDTNSLVSNSLKGVTSRNPPDLTTVALAKVFVHTFLDETPVSLQDQAWSIAPNEVRRLFVLSPRVMLFAHRPLSSLCHPHLSTMAWRSDLSTKLSSSEANEDLLSWKLNAAVSQAQHLAQMAMKRHKSREATNAAYHGSVVPPEASQASLHTRRFISLVDALETDVLNYDEEMRAPQSLVDGDDDETEESSSASSAESSLLDDDESSDEDEDDDDEGVDSPKATVLVKNVESGVYFASQRSTLTPEERERRRLLKRQKKQEAKRLRLQRRQENQKRRLEKKQRKNRGEDDRETAITTTSSHYRRHQKYIPLSDKWLFLAELHAHIRMCSDKVKVHTPVSAASDSRSHNNYNAMIHNILTSQLPARSSARLEASKCIDRWRMNPQIMSMLRSMFKRLATIPADPRIARRNLTALKRSMSMNFHSSSKKNNRFGGSEENEAIGKSERVTLQVGGAMTPNDFDVEGGHLRRRLSRVFSSSSSASMLFGEDAEDNNNSQQQQQQNQSPAEMKEFEAMEQAYISVSSFVLFQQRLFSTLYHSTSDEQVVCAALLDFLLDSEYVGGSKVSAAASSSTTRRMNLSSSSSFNNNNNNNRNNNDDEYDSDIEEEEAKSLRDKFSKKELNSFARLSSHAMSKKLQDEMTVAAEQRERERVIAAASSASKRASIEDMKKRMKDKVMAVARQLSKNSELYVDRSSMRPPPSNSNNNDMATELGRNSNNDTTTTSTDVFRLTSTHHQQAQADFGDDLLIQAQRTVNKYGPSATSAQNQPGGGGGGRRPLLSASAAAAAATSSSATSAVPGISNTAKNLLQVAEFGRFGVFFEGFCKFMFELCDNWAASHSVDGVAAFLGFLCRVAFPYPIDTIWARATAAAKQKEQREKQQQQNKDKSASKEDQMLQNSNLDTAFDILEQQAAEDAEDDGEDGGNKKKKKRKSEGDVLNSIIEASKKNARKNMFGNNKKKPSSSPSSKKSGKDDDASSLPQIVVHSPDFADSNQSHKKDKHQHHQKKKKDRKRVTFKFDIIDEFASDEDVEDEDIEDDENKNKQDASLSASGKKSLKTSKRYSNKKYNKDENNEDDNPDDSDDNNDEKSSEETTSIKSPSSIESGILPLPAKGDHKEASGSMRIFDDSISSNVNDNSNNNNSQQLESSLVIDSGEIKMIETPSDDDNDHNHHLMSTKQNDTNNNDVSSSLLTPGSAFGSHDDMFDSLLALPEENEFTALDEHGKPRRNSKNTYKNLERLLSFSGIMSDVLSSGDGPFTPLKGGSRRSSLAGGDAKPQVDWDKLLTYLDDEDFSDDDGENNEDGKHTDVGERTSSSQAQNKEKRTDAAKRRQEMVVRDLSTGRTQPIQIDGDALALSSSSRSLEHVNLLIDILRKRKARFSQANQKSRSRQEIMKDKLEQKKEEEKFEELLWILKNQKRDPVLERYSHVLPANPPTDKQGNAVKKTLVGKTARPFQERRYLFSQHHQQQEHHQYHPHHADDNEARMRNEVWQQQRSSSSSSIRGIRPNSSSSSSLKTLKRDVYPMMSTTFHTGGRKDHDDDLLATSRSSSSLQERISKAADILLKTMVVGGTRKQLNAMMPVRPSSCSSTSAAARFSGRQKRMKIEEEKEKEKTETKLEVVDDHDEGNKLQQL